MSQIPPLNGLRAFDVAGRFLNFRAAADELGVTQGAVAQHVRQLEAHLGLPLFERLPKGLAFTS
ncbi:MAG: LysR family transcriptional regulator, partial [Paracoccaceae bacterium]|nr:LysR family transcriptional regulator [Paracoccaceae bacterium]